MKDNRDIVRENNSSNSSKFSGTKVLFRFRKLLGPLCDNVTET